MSAFVCLSQRLHLAEWRALIILVAGIVLLSGLGEAGAETLTLAGSTTFNAHFMMPYQNQIEAISGQKIISLSNRTNMGAKMLFERQADLAMTSVATDILLPFLRRTEPNLPLDKLQSFEIYRTRVAFTVHPENPVRSITSDALRRVLLGEIANWKELGGPDRPIRLVMVRDGGGVQLTIEAQLLEGRVISTAEPIRLVATAFVNKVVAQEPDALGLAQIENLNSRVAELRSDRDIELTFSLLSAGEPTEAMQSVISASRKIAQERMQ